MCEKALCSAATSRNASHEHGEFCKTKSKCIGRRALSLLQNTSQTADPIISIHRILPILKSLVDSTKPQATNMSLTNSNNSNSPNNSKSDGSSITVSDNDLRCRFCGHNRSKCSICQAQRSHSSVADRRKAKKIPRLVARSTAASASTRVSSPASSIHITRRCSLWSITPNSRSMPLPDLDHTSFNL